MCLLRHTFYTPRQVLRICDAILACVDNFESPVDARRELSAGKWSRIFQSCIEEFTREHESNFRDLFSLIYDGLDQTLRAFRSRPHIWNRQQLLSFVDGTALRLTRKDTKESYMGERLIEALQRIGFLGFGTRRFDSGMLGFDKYDMKFAFLEQYPFRGGWDIAVISPLFYDTYEISLINHEIVRPHEVLTLSREAIHKITSYDPEVNRSRE